MLVDWEYTKETQIAFIIKRSALEASMEYYLSFKLQLCCALASPNESLAF
jgi:hypothetical protein